MSQFPPDAITITGSVALSAITNSVQIKNLPTDSTILYARLWAGQTAPAAGVVTIKCGSPAGSWTNLALVDKTTLKDQLNMSFECPSTFDLYVHDTVAETSNPYYSVTYVPYYTRLAATTTNEAILGSATGTPLYVQDSGNVVFGLTLLIFFASLMFVAFLFNNISNKKRK